MDLITTPTVIEVAERLKNFQELWLSDKKGAKSHWISVGENRCFERFTNV